jgi:hypothetical protein
MAKDGHDFWASLPVRYRIPTTFMAASAIGLFFLGDPAGLIVMKTAAVPLYFLASRVSARSSHQQPRGHPGCRFTSSVSFLRSLIFICWLTIFLWRPDLSATRIVVIFLLAIVSMTVVRMLIDAFSVKRKAAR